MDIILHILRDIVIEDGGDIIDINAARGDIRRNQNIDEASAKAVHDLGAFSLLHISVQTPRLIAACMELFDKLVDLLFGIAENNGTARIIDVEQAAQDLSFFPDGHFVIGLLNIRYRQLFPRDFDQFWICLVLFCNPHDFRRHRGGKENGLPLLGDVLENRFDILAEAHAEHLIGLVKDDHLEMIKLKCAAPHMVHHTPRRAHDDLSPTAQSGELPLDRLAAIDRHDLDKWLVFGKFSDFIAGLYGELARGAED